MNKTVLAIHDLSGIGNTSLMAIIPLMYRHGIRVSALPTAMLSGNTCFPGYRGLDTSAFMKDSIAHWQELGLKFSAIYSGFLGNPDQVDTVLKAIDTFADQDCLIAVDPVMADGGELYDCYDESMVTAMRRLVAKADLICPNYTEACLLAGHDPASDCDADMLDDICRRLHELGAIEIIITSVPSGSGTTACNVLYSSPDHPRFIHNCQYLPCFYTGTGDIFSALMVISRLSGLKLTHAIPRAANFIFEAIKLSQKQSQDGAWGVVLEQILFRHEF